MRLPAFGPTQVFVQLVRMGLGLLQGHHLGVRAAKPVPGLLAGHSPQAVHIPRYKFKQHTFLRGAA